MVELSLAEVRAALARAGQTDSDIFDDVIYEMLSASKAPLKREEIVDRLYHEFKLGDNLRVSRDAIRTMHDAAIKHLMKQGRVAESASHGYHVVK